MVRALIAGLFAALLAMSVKAAPARPLPARTVRSLPAVPVAVEAQPAETAPPSSVRVEPAVKRGDNVAIVVRSGALEIRADGRALSSGERGQKVRVFNASTRRTIEGFVDAPGIVVVVAR